MLLRQVPRNEAQGNRLRPLRGQGDSLARAPQAHGTHHAGRPRRSHLVLQSDAFPSGEPSGHQDQFAGARDLLPGLHRHPGRGHAAEEGAVAQRRGAARRAGSVRRALHRPDGRRGGSRTAAWPGPPGRGEGLARRTQFHALQAAREGHHQAPAPRRGAQGQHEQAGVDGAGSHPGHPARPSPAGPAGERQLRHQRPERPVPPHHQPQQPAQETDRPERA